MRQRRASNPAATRGIARVLRRPGGATEAARLVDEAASAGGASAREPPKVSPWSGCSSSSCSAAHSSRCSSSPREARARWSARSASTTKAGRPAEPCSRRRAMRRSQARPAARARCCRVASPAVSNAIVSYRARWSAPSSAPRRWIAGPAGRGLTSCRTVPMSDPPEARWEERRQPRPIPPARWASRPGRREVPRVPWAAEPFTRPPANTRRPGPGSRGGAPPGAPARTGARSGPAA